jgi:hypothetical protein
LWDDLKPMANASRMNGKKTSIVLAASIGFTVPFVLFFVVMSFFSAKDSAVAHFFSFQFPRILCPMWALGNQSAFWIFTMPLWNALTYAVVFFLWLKVKEFFRTATPS